jgi:hypothetical protein
MFKLIFRTIVIVLFLVSLTVGLAVWKGGEPFRILGEGTVVIGKSIMEFGDFVDEFIEGGKKLHKSYDELKDTINP